MPVSYGRTSRFCSAVRAATPAARPGRHARAGRCNGSAEDEAILRDAVSIEEGDGYIAELAKAVYDSPKGETHEPTNAN
jgi:hypothetical protein